MARETTRVRRTPTAGAGEDTGELPGGSGPGRTQDQRGQTGRTIDASRLEADVREGLAQGEERPGDGELDDPTDGGQEDIAALRRQLAREKRRADSAEARVSEAETRTGEALDAKTQSDLNTLRSAKTTLETKQQDAKKRLAQAHADGDFDAIAEIQLEMSQAAVSLSSIDNGIIALEQAPKQREALARRGADDPQFTQITKGMAPVAKQWFRDNPEYYRDRNKLNRVIAAANLVMSTDDPPEENTDEYFDLVQAELGRFDPKFASGSRSQGSGGGADGDLDDTDNDAMSGAAGGRGRRADVAPASAPVTRSRGQQGQQARNGNGARLTPEEREAADSSGLTYEEYATNKADLIREQRVGPGARNRNLH